MSASPSEPGWRVVEAAVTIARDHLGDGLISAYAIGSLAHGGFRSSVSDVDLALLTDERSDRNTTEIVAAIAGRVRATELQLADRLSVFHAPWARFREPPRDARFPAIDRYDLVHHGVLVHGEDRRATDAVAPEARQIRAQAVDSALRRVTVAGLAAELERLRGGGVSVHDATKAVLWPVRLQHVCDTGAATGNSDAVAHYRGLPDAGHRELVGEALAWRDLTDLPDPAATLTRIVAELPDLHAEVFHRLGGEPGLPCRDALAARARQMRASPP